MDDGMRTGATWLRGTMLVSGLVFLAFAGSAESQTRPPQDPKAPTDTRERAPAARDDKSTLTKSVTGTVKDVRGEALVIEEQRSDGSKGKEWAFAVGPETRTSAKKGGKQIATGELKAGDRVAVTYSDRAGKVVAENITRLDGTTTR
jgi:hypothetical protein